MRGVSLEEVSAATRISTRFLEAIESDKWESLPGGVFNRGFIRSVARYLGLDEDSMVAEYSLETRGRVEAGVVPDPPMEMPRNWKPAIVAAIVLVVILAGVGFAYARYGGKIAGRLHWRPGLRRRRWFRGRRAMRLAEQMMLLGAVLLLRAMVRRKIRGRATEPLRVRGRPRLIHWNSRCKRASLLM